MKKVLAVLLVIVIGILISQKYGSIDGVKKYPGYKWDSVELNNLPEGYRSLYVLGPSGSVIKKIDGKAFTTSIEDTDIELFFIKMDDFYKFQNEKITKKGWSRNAIDVGEYKLTPLVADGPSGGTFGFIKQVGDTISLYQISEKWINSSHDQTSGKIVCPCEYEITVFESDPVPISALISEDE